MSLCDSESLSLKKFVVEWSGGGLGQFLGSALVKLNNNKMDSNNKNSNKDNNNNINFSAVANFV